MPVEKTPAADLRRRYPLYAEAGLALALGAAILAFTVPSPQPQRAVYATDDPTPIPLSDLVPPTVEPPPPPPPAAPPPPVEVEDDVEIDNEVIETLELILDDVVPPPVTPPQPPAPPAPPVPPVVHIAPPMPPPPPVVDDVEDRVFDVAEVQPELIGGLGALQALVEYPEFARRTGITGTVYVRFVVDQRGQVVEPEVVRSSNDLLSQASLAAVRQIRFTPGQQRGRPVKVRFTVPVTFRLR